MQATAKTPDPVTGLTRTAMAWQMNPEVPGDATTAMSTVAAAGYDGRLNTKSDAVNPKTVPPLVSVVIMSGDYLQAQNITVTMDANTTDWILFDGQHAWVLADSDAQTAYDFTEWVAPPPPPPPPQEPALIVNPPPTSPPGPLMPPVRS